MTQPAERSATDRFTATQGILDMCARSSALRDAVISGPLAGCGGATTIEVDFGRHASVFRVVAPTADEAYALLYELAASMVGDGHGPAAARRPRRRRQRPTTPTRRLKSVMRSSM